MGLGFSLRIFLPDGSPEGLRLVEKSNWTGHGIVCPRPLFRDAKSRSEYSRAGIYVLIGQSAGEELPQIYIGEGDPIRPRLESHQASKDFWTSSLCFTSKDSNLNKAHVQYLESRLVAIALDARRCVLDNGNVPQLPSLSESDIADMENFLVEMLLCFPVLGVTVFEKPSGSVSRADILYLSVGDLSARGYEAADGFVVLADSGVRRDESVSAPDFVSKTKAVLLENGVLSAREFGLRFEQDYEFRSPSGAASLIMGVAVNGRTAWRDPVGRTLKEIQESS